jgi:hypothetical protein
MAVLNFDREENARKRKSKKMQHTKYSNWAKKICLVMVSPSVAYSLHIAL